MAIFKSGHTSYLWVIQGSEFLSLGTFIFKITELLSCLLLKSVSINQDFTVMTISFTTNTVFPFNIILHLLKKLEEYFVNEILCRISGIDMGRGNNYFRFSKLEEKVVNVQPVVLVCGLPYLFSHIHIYPQSLTKLSEI